MTYSDLLYLCALIAVIAGVAFVALAFFGVLVAIGAGFLALAGALWYGARVLARDTT